ncbi:hypothetical protein [Treponema sp. Marseille-Q4130]|uniref:hypothetical protein n=1 Tax=Treponema sp. Marseille-Q4130 TaxID=2766702 RepID=UPI001651E991|nr:hypothetical protein [Treponema sp. Marseille-Q4130]MBC6720065.1 hypothetical protein [Treponema sp. Marseille-Q4130]
MEFYRTEVDSCGNIKKTNKAFDFSIKKICELIYCKRFDLFVKLLKNKKPVIVYTMALFLLPISEIKTFKWLLKLFILKGYSVNSQTLWAEYKSGRLKFPKLINGKVIYVFKEEYLEQFTQEEKKQILSSV